MGTWGAGSFDNDSALDWIQDFAEEPAIAKIASALTLTGEDELADALDCEEAIVAAEVICLLGGNCCPDFPQEEKEALQHHPMILPPGLKDQAASTMKRIIEQSELRDLWEESGDVNEWLDAMTALIHRLHAVS